MINRRVFLAASPLALTGCVSHQRSALDEARAQIDPYYQEIYGALSNEPFPVPAIDLTRVDPRFWRREVPYSTPYTPGTIVVDPGARYAYLVREGGRALRYGVGVGREEAFNFNGEAVIQRKAEWPRWIPTQDMIAREPQRYAQYAGGVPGGLENPLGARALYLYRDGRDTYYRLHGTIEPWTIGTMVSSGCVRFMNQDIIDLHRRVPVGSRVVVLPSSVG